MRYLRWDYDRGEVIEYQRRGECNGCGACCIARIAFNVSMTAELPLNTMHDWDRRDVRDGGDATNGKGVWTGLLFDNGASRYWQITEIDRAHTEACPLLGEGNRCARHNHVNNLCTEWPLAPEQVTPFPDCSFSFVEIGRWPIEEVKST